MLPSLEESVIDWPLHLSLLLILTDRRKKINFTGIKTLTMLKEKFWKGKGRGSSFLYLF